MSNDNSNPYASPPTTPLPEERFSRPLSSILVAGIHMIGYLILVLAGIALLLSIISGVGGFSGARADEVALAWLAISAAPVAGWLVRMEIRCFFFPTEQRERLLSRMAMLATVAPVLMSGFWFYEYAAFGSYQLNAVPGIQAALFSLVWCASGAYRWLRAVNK